MRLTPPGIEFIKSLEGCRLSAYQDSAGVWTIGYGCTSGVRPGDKMSQEQADNLLISTLRRYESTVSCATLRPMNIGEFTAFVSFSYNVGSHAFRTSALLSKFNLGDKEGCANQFEIWDRAGGIINLGLVRRRAKERDLFLGVRTLGT